MRDVIVNMHIPKTGGITMRGILSRNFGHRHYDLVENEDILGKVVHVQKKGFSVLDLPKYLEPAKNDCVALSRHDIVLDPARLREYERTSEYRFAPIFFMRSWFDWMLSHYYHTKSKKHSDADRIRRSASFYHIIALTASPHEYVQYVSSTRLDMISPRILPMLGIRTKKRKGITAEQFMEHVGLYRVGITERYDESLAVIEHELAPRFPGIDMSYAKPLNVNKLRQHASYAPERESIDADLMRRLEESHATIIELYGLVSSELDRRISAVPDFDKRLEDFQRRCKKRLQNGTRWYDGLNRWRNGLRRQWPARG